MSLEPEEIAEIARVVVAAIDTKTTEFYVAREKHYQHHEFLNEFIGLMKTSKQTATKVIIVVTVSAVIGLMVAGMVHKVIEWVK